VIDAERWNDLGLKHRDLPSLGKKSFAVVSERVQ
jgi:hypothetical protein